MREHRSSVAALVSLLARAILQENRYLLFLIAPSSGFREK